MDRCGLDEKEQAAPADDAHSLALGGTLLAAGRPELSLHTNLTFREARSGDDRDVAEQRLRARPDAPPARKPHPEGRLADLDGSRARDEGEAPGAVDDEDGQEYGDDEENRSSFA